MLVIGIGNEFRQDDGAGLAVAERVRALGMPGVEVLTHHGEGTGLMALWQGRSAVIVVDAVSSGKPVGTIHQIDAIHNEIPPDMTVYSSHAFGLAGAIELGRDLGDLPPVLWVLGIEGKNFSYGQSFSPEVAESLERVVAQVIELAPTGT